MTTLLVCIFYELLNVRIVTEDVFNHPDRSNEIYLRGVLQARRFMLDFVKENFTGNPKLRTQMFMFIFKTIVPQVELVCVSVSCANVRTLPVAVQKLVS